MDFEKLKQDLRNDFSELFEAFKKTNYGQFGISFNYHNLEIECTVEFDMNDISQYSANNIINNYDIISATIKKYPDEFSFGFDKILDYDILQSDEIYSDFLKEVASHPTMILFLKNRKDLFSAPLNNIEKTISELLKPQYVKKFLVKLFNSAIRDGLSAVDNNIDALSTKQLKHDSIY